MFTISSLCRVQQHFVCQCQSTQSLISVCPTSGESKFTKVRWPLPRSGGLGAGHAEHVGEEWEVGVSVISSSVVPHGVVFLSQRCINDLSYVYLSCRLCSSSAVAYVPSGNCEP